MRFATSLLLTLFASACIGTTEPRAIQATDTSGGLFAQQVMTQLISNAVEVCLADETQLAAVEARAVANRFGPFRDIDVGGREGRIGSIEFNGGSLIDLAITSDRLVETEVLRCTVLTSLQSEPLLRAALMDTFQNSSGTGSFVIEDGALREIRASGTEDRRNQVAALTPLQRLAVISMRTDRTQSLAIIQVFEKPH